MPRGRKIERSFIYGLFRNISCIFFSFNNLGMIHGRIIMEPVTSFLVA